MVAIIINPIAGGPRQPPPPERAQLAWTVLERAGERGEVFVTDSKGHARELADRAVKRGARLVIAWGADGTVNEVATSLVESGTPLGIVPSGSGNGLARELAISRDPKQAMTEAIGARARPIDAGRLGGRLFVSIAGIGFDAQIAACFDEQTTRRRGFITYARVTGRELLRYRCRSYRVSTASDPVDHKALFVTIANSPQWGNGARIAPSARVDDGLLDLVVFEETSRVSTVCAIPRVFRGSVTRIRGVKTRQITQAVIESDSPMLFHVDGEPVEGGARLEACVLPGALNVAVR